MSSAAPNFYLASYLAPLSAWLERPDVTDIFVNRPGEVWLESNGTPPVRIEAPELTSEVLTRLVRQVAAFSAQGINREHPLLAASLPDGERIQVAIPPATRGEIAIAIRKHVVAGLTLQEFHSTGAFEATQVVADAQSREDFSEHADGEGTVGMLRRAVLARKNILISGGTSSGKTTFVNALLREIPIDERLIVIEDTPELQIVHDNAVGLIAARGRESEAEVSAEDLLIAALRMRPDRIILGEVRGSEEVTFLRAINTGHPGSMSTIHADSPSRAVDQLALLVLQSGTSLGWDDVVRYIRRSIDVIVQLERRGGQRVVSAIAVNSDQD